MSTDPIAGIQSPRGPLPPFGQLLRQWRDRRRLSQLDLAGEAEISTRHLSFVETGRSRPSRETILRLCRALEVPPRGRNELLTAAGFAPIYRESAWDAPELALARQALDRLLRQQEPYPAMLVDRHWNMIQSNGAMARFLACFLDPAAAAAAGAPNAIRLSAHPRGLRPFIRNWEAVSATFIQWLRRDYLHTGDAETGRLIDEILASSKVPSQGRTFDLDVSPAPFLTIEMEKDDLRLSLFTVLAGLGTAFDITLHEVRIECFFPADEASETSLRRLAGTF